MGTRKSFSHTSNSNMSSIFNVVLWICISERTTMTYKYNQLKVTFETYGVADVDVDAVAEIFENFVEVAGSGGAQEPSATVRLTSTTHNSSINSSKLSASSALHLCSK